MSECGLMGGMRGGADFAVKFGEVCVCDELVEHGVCGVDGVDGFGCEKGREPVLPVVVATFDFAFCLWGGSVAEGDAVKPESLAELCESVREVGEKEGVIIDIKRKREAVGEEGEGEEMEMRRKVFGMVDTGTGIEACGVVEDIEQGIFTRVAGEPSVRRGIVLPERPEVADLPSADGFIGLFVVSIRSEFVSDSPSADGGTVGLEIEAAEQLAGDGAVGGGRF